MTREPTRSEIVRATFERAADHYDHPAQGHWAVTADRTLEAAALGPGERVLDVCCGSGSTAIPAARQVGREGEVVGVDLSEAMLDLAREKQRAAGLANLRFEVGDLLALPHAEAAFDVVLCQLGLFFLDSPGDGAAALFRHVRPGGRLILTTFLGAPLAPATGLLREVLEAENGLPEDGGPVRPGPTTTAEGMRSLVEAIGGSEVDVRVSAHRVELARPEDFWPIALGSGMRGMLDRLGDETRERVRARLVERLRAEDVRALTWDLLLTRASK